MKSDFVKITTVLALSVSLFGCNGSGVATTATTSAMSPYVAKTEPVGALPVGEARRTAKTNDEIALVGHIGGSAKPFVDGMAAFTIVDPKVAYCAPDEGCPTPWDYCCEQNEVKQNIAVVKIVDAKGKTVAQDAKKLLGVKELSLVVAQGIAQRDEQGNLTLMATHVYLKDPAK
jgi:hypothetical protein